MTYLLIFITLLLSFLIVYLILKSYQSQKKFQTRLTVLEDFIIELNKEHQKQSIQLQLSEDLKIKLKQVNTVLNQNVFELNYQLFENSFPKKDH